jgi:orotate phosphoribosyltransferase-like protein
MTTSEDRHAKADEKLEQVKKQIAEAFVLNSKGYSIAKIAEEMNVSESTVRTLIAAPDEFRS